MSDPQALHVTRNVIPGKLGVDLHLHRVHIPLVHHNMVEKENRKKYSNKKGRTCSSLFTSGVYSTSLLKVIRQALFLRNVRLIFIYITVLFLIRLSEFYAFFISKKYYLLTYL